MLKQLRIKNFVIIDELIVDFFDKMTVITGETGAGKSIAIEALGLCLGQRGELSLIKEHCDFLEVSVEFEISNKISSQQFLNENQIPVKKLCILRRILTKEGRSQAFINETRVSLSKLKEFAETLIQIHSQNHHQLLLKSSHQRFLLDSFMQKPNLLTEMKMAFHSLQKAKSDLENFLMQQKEFETQKQLIEFQLQEFNDFLPNADEFEQLETEFKTLSNFNQLNELLFDSCELLSDGEQNNVLSFLRRVQIKLTQLNEITDSKFESSLKMLDESTILLNEIYNDLNISAKSLENDPQKLNEIENRLSNYLNFSKKYRVSPENLHEFHTDLRIKLEKMENSTIEQENLEKNIDFWQQKAIKNAEILFDERKKSAKILSNLMTEKIRDLSLPNGVFDISIEFNPQNLNSQGADLVEFLVALNDEKTTRPLGKSASGGELSRISLAMQVITAQKMEAATLIFDEVDVGISGQTAAQVGKQLRLLGKSSQLICITHLPQVAGNAHHHYFVSKESNHKETQTNMILLKKSQRLNELARLLGGEKITENTLANARELLVCETQN